MKQQIIQKLTSRKFWAAIIGVVVGLAAAFGIDSNEYAQVAGVVTSAISVFSYLFAEGKVDAARAGNEPYIIDELIDTIPGDETQSEPEGE